MAVAVSQSTFVSGSPLLEDDDAADELDELAELDELDELLVVVVGSPSHPDEPTRTSKPEEMRKPKSTFERMEPPRKKDEGSTGRCDEAPARNPKLLHLLTDFKAEENTNSRPESYDRHSHHAAHVIEGIRKMAIFAP